jgi:ligand-binding sensor domain-containing protein/two-component sensor histidine kinase
MIRSLIMMLFLCAAVHYNGSAQASLLNFEHIIPENGWPDNYINRTVLDQRGFLWVATKNGLCRFDGKRSETISYHFEGKDFSGGHVTSLAIDNNNMLWAIWDGHLIQIQTITLRTKVIDPNFNQDSQSFYGQLHFSQKTGLWIGGSRFVNIKTTDVGEISNITVYNDTIQEVNNITEFPDGRIVFLCEREGTFILDPETNKTSHHKFPLIPETNRELNNHRCGFVDHNNTLWIGNYYKAFFRLNNKGEFDIFKYTSASSESNSIYNNMVRSITEIRTESGTYELLLGTYDAGLARFNPEQGTFSFHKNDINIASSLCFNNIRHILDDHQGKLWISTANGLDKIDINEQKFTYIRFPLQTENTIDNWCISVIQDLNFKDNGMLWAGTYGGGLFRISAKTGLSEVVANFHEQGISILSQRIESPTKHHIAGLDQYFIFNQINGKISEQYKYQDIGDFSHLELNQIHGLLYSEDSLLFIGNPVGVFSFHRKTHHITKHEKFGEISLDYCIDKLGRLWVGHLGGITFFDKKTEQFVNFTATESQYATLNDFVFGLTYDKKRNRVWACTPSGLSFIDCSTLQVTELNDFPKQNYVDVETDSNDNIWFYSVNGLTGYNPETGNRVFYRLQDIMYASAGDYAKILPLPDGRIVLTANGGICIINAQNLLSAKNKTLPVEFTHFYNQFNPIDFSQPIEIDYFNNNIRITFSCLNFGMTDNIHFEYALGETIESWQNIGNTGEMAFANLPHGTYQFNIRAVSNDGQIIGQPQSITFTILPAYYQTWWFRILLILFVSGILFGIYKYRIRQLTKLQMVRDNISRDLHDDIGATLSSINITSSLIQRKTKNHPDMDQLLGGMRNDIKHASEALDDIVWSIQPKNDTWPILLSRMRRYASQILENSQMAYTIDFPELDSHQRMKIEQRRDVYLIFKEIVNNAAKHSAAQKVTIRFRLHSENLKLEISDDGKGFDPKSASNRNGLVNLKSRIDRWKGSITIQSELGKGTLVVVSMPRV